MATDNTIESLLKVSVTRPWRYLFHEMNNNYIFPRSELTDVKNVKKREQVEVTVYVYFWSRIPFCKSMPNET